MTGLREFAKGFQSCIPESPNDMAEFDRVSGWFCMIGLVTRVLIAWLEALRPVMILLIRDGRVLPLHAQPATDIPPAFEAGQRERD